jgi:dTDP-4-dehydrorhamnose reductase
MRMSRNIAANLHTKPPCLNAQNPRQLKKFFGYLAPPMEIKKILVTGYSGQLGYFLVQSLSELFPSVQISHPSRTELDWSSQVSIQTYFQQNNFDVIFHAAAYTQVDLAEEQTSLAFDINAHGIEWLAECINASKTWLWYFSTDYVFDGTKNSPYTESDVVHPINVYGQSKNAGETLVRNHFPHHTILRISWLYSTRGKNFFKTMLALAETRSELSIVDDQTGSPTNAACLAADIAKFFLQKKELPGTFHYSPQGETTWFGFAKKIFEFNQQNISIKAVSSADFPQKANRPQYSKLDSNKWIEATGITPETWENQLEQCFDNWHKKQ